MKLHPTVVAKILNLVENYGGHSDHRKLKERIEGLDFTPYEQKTGNQDIILVLTEDYMKQLSGGR